MRLEIGDFIMTPYTPFYCTRQPGVVIRPCCLGPINLPRAMHVLLMPSFRRCPMSHKWNDVQINARDRRVPQARAFPARYYRPALPASPRPPIDHILDQACPELSRPSKAAHKAGFASLPSAAPTRSAVEPPAAPSAPAVNSSPPISRMRYSCSMASRFCSSA